MDTFNAILGWVIYGAQGVTALWGLFCVIVVWRRIAQARFRSDDAQAEFLGELERGFMAGDLQGALAACEADPRAVPQLAAVAIENRQLGYAKLRHLLADRFQRDFLADIEHRLSWVSTVIKSAPMLGLFGTVTGMAGAFSTIAGGSKMDPENAATLAQNISFALITTVVGLAIAIPLMLAMASITVRLRKLEDQAGLGLNQFMDIFRGVLEASRRQVGPPVGV